MRKIWSVPLMVLFFGGIAPPLAAQQFPRVPLTLELRLGAGAPTGDFADPAVGIDAETGFGFSVGASVRVAAPVAIYGSYQWTQFGCAECEAIEIDGDATDSGAEIGARALIPFEYAGISPWVSAGILFHQLGLSGDNQSISSEVGTGFGLGGGVSVPLMPNLLLTPGIHFRSYTAEFELDDLGTFGEDMEVLNVETDVSHMTLDIGLAYRF